MNAGHLIIALVVAFLLWKASVVIWPYKKCEHCKGLGSKPSFFSEKISRTCGVCNGMGRVPRIGSGK